MENYPEAMDLLIYPQKVQMILSQTNKWASKCVDICVAAMVGSWARGTAQPTSDIDIMLLVAEPDIFRKDQVWVNEIDWEEVGL